MSVLERDGFEIVTKAIPEVWLSRLDACLQRDIQNTRNLLQEPEIREFAASRPVRSIVEPALGSECVAVRGILFNKSADSNWKVAWHQDCVIAVKRRQEIKGWGPWSLKASVPHVRPSADVLSGMLTIRIHIDDCPPENGALHVLPGSHEKGFLSDAEITALNKRGQRVCPASRGDVLLMRPLLLHASSSAEKPSARRVLHLEFAPSRRLPNGVEWFDIVGCNPHRSGSQPIQ